MVKKLDAQSPNLRPYPRVGKTFTKPSKTRVSEMASTDLGALVRRFKMAGGIPPSQLRFGDVSGLPTSRLEAMTRIDAAMDAFNELPLKVRQAVNHDPRRLEDWLVSNPQLAAEYGLVTISDEKSSPANPTSSGGAGEGKKGGGNSEPEGALNRFAASSSSGRQPTPTDTAE